MQAIRKGHLMILLARLDFIVSDAGPPAADGRQQPRRIWLYVIHAHFLKSNRETSISIERERSLPLYMFDI